MWRPTINSASDGLRGAEDLLDASSKILRERLVLHSPCDLINLVERDVSSVLDVLLFFTIPWGLCERLD
jgi:hypothetical protein